MKNETHCLVIYQEESDWKDFCRSKLHTSVYHEVRIKGKLLMLKMPEVSPNTEPLKHYFFGARYNLFDDNQFMQSLRGMEFNTTHFLLGIYPENIVNFALSKIRRI